MDVDVYQEQAHTFADYPVPELNGTKLPWDYPAHGIAEEAGEVAGKFAKAIRDCDGKIDGVRKDAIVKELGDVCWFVAELATLLDVPMSVVMWKKKH